MKQSFKVNFEFQSGNVVANMFLEELKKNGFSAITSVEEIPVSETKQLPEVKTVETGVLKLPNKEYCLCRDRVTFIHNSTINLTEYPELRQYCDPNSIQKTWDFASIPKNALIEIVCLGNTLDDAYYGRLRINEELRLRVGQWNISKDTIKSIRIIELPKDGE